MITKQEIVYDLSGGVMDILSREQDRDLDELDAMGHAIANFCYDALLQTNRAILVDKDGNIIGSIDLIGKANLWMKSELDWQKIVYDGLGIKP